MHPVLFELAGFKIYAYGFFIAIGTVAGVAYMAWQGKKEIGLTFDQANTLFLIIFMAAFIGGKLFLFFEDPSYYRNAPGKLFTGQGFVFYGSFLLAVPAMLWYFKKQKLPVYAMLDIMAVTTCLVHMFGRVGCFMAGCCYGIPTASVVGVVFTDPACKAPLNASLHPTQLYEAVYILLVLVVILIIKKYFQHFKGQLFLLYLILYATGRAILETFRGDEVRGFVFGSYVSHSQFIAILIILVVIFVYRKWSMQNVIKR